MSVNSAIGCSPLPISTDPVQARSLPSFKQLFEQHSPFVYRALRYLGVADADLDDMFQEVFVLVHRRLHTFSGRSKPKTWLYGIVWRVASDYRRSAPVRRRKDQVGDSVLLDQTAAHSSTMGHTEARDLLQKALAELDDDKRAVAVLHRIEGFSMPEVAQILGCPVQTAYTRWNAARERLIRFVERADRAGRGQ